MKDHPTTLSIESFVPMENPVRLQKTYEFPVNSSLENHGRAPTESTRVPKRKVFSTRNMGSASIRRRVSGSLSSRVSESFSQEG